MYESLNITALTAPQAAVVLGLLVGLGFGALAEITGFCFRRSLVGSDRKQAMGIWMTALAVAILGTQGAAAMGWITFADHRFYTAQMPVLAIATGGLMFGAGMVLTRGCVSRLTVLGATGNTRGLLVVAVFAITAHATLKGILAPVRTTLGSVTVNMGDTLGFGALPGGPLLWTLVLAAAALVIAATSRNRPVMLVLAALLGLLVPLAWVGTGFVLYDDFDPIAMESLSFTSAWADTLFWTIASTSIPAGFGSGLIGGVLVGALIASLAGGRFRWQSFESPGQTGRYMAGAGLMGMGGVMAGGCTVGAGLAGVPTLSFAAVLALGSIAVGALVCDALLGRAPARQPA